MWMGMEKVTKQDIIKSLKKHRRDLAIIINGFEQLDETNNSGLNRVLVRKIVLTLFELVDAMVDTEVNIHNFMKRRG